MWIEFLHVCYAGKKVVRHRSWTAIKQTYIWVLAACLWAFRSFLFWSGGFAKTISICSPSKSFPCISARACGETLWLKSKYQKPQKLCRGRDNYLNSTISLLEVDEGVVFKLFNPFQFAKLTERLLEMLFRYCARQVSYKKDFDLWKVEQYTLKSARECLVKTIIVKWKKWCENVILFLVSNIFPAKTTILWCMW